MKHTIPHTPFSTALSGSARTTELRLKNIFSGPKKRPPALFLALVFSLCIFCGNLVSCQVAKAGENTDDVFQADASRTDENMTPLPYMVPAKDLEPDLNHNGIPEEIRLENKYGSDEIWFYENGELIDREQPGVCLYSSTDGPDYILRTHADNEYPGAFSYYYSISDLSGEFEEIIKWNEIRFDINFNAPFHRGFDPAAIAAYVEELNGLYSHSLRLVVWNGELAAEEPHQTLPWLDDYPEIFTRDRSKSPEENLRGFQAAMIAAYPPADPVGTVDTLPIPQSLEVIFASGAGAWCTGLNLNPDGTFTADYHDADGATLYVCQYHGRFGDFVQLTENSWSLTLEELVLDTKYPVGKEWDEDGYHMISSGPAGFEDGDGNALRPGAQFILYSSGAQGYGPGTELYGAEDFLSWNLARPRLSDTSDTLGCWGLYNLQGDIGFFSDI